MLPRSLAALFVALIAPMAGAADFSDPDWPCIQRKQPHLSLAQVWSGPVPDAAAEHERFTAEAHLQLEELFLFMDPARLFVLNLLAFATLAPYLRIATQLPSPPTQPQARPRTAAAFRSLDWARRVSGSDRQWHCASGKP